MAEFDPGQADAPKHGGTFSANPILLHAGIEALQLFDEPAVERLNGFGRAGPTQLHDPTATTGWGWSVQGSGSSLRPFPPDEIGSAGAMQHRLYWAVYTRGPAIMPTALLALSTPMDRDTVRHRRPDG